MDLIKQKLELVKLKQLKATKLRDAYSADNLDSRPTGAQAEFLNDIARYPIRWAVCDNRCLIEGTLVATPSGPTPIELLKVGDTVYDEHGKPIRVKAVYNQGVQEVWDLVHKTTVMATATSNHVWLASQHQSGNKIKEIAVKDFTARTAICRTEVTPPLGEVDVPTAYALGVMLGDGCCKQSNGRGSFFYVSSASHHIPQAVSPSAVKCSGENYTWKIPVFDIAHYDSWCRNKYAHEKIIDLDVVKTWNRKSVLRLLAGLIDTDGSVRYRAKYNLIEMAISMQSKSCIEFVKWAYLALYQLNVNIGIDDRDKYVNGPCYVLKVRNSHVNKRMLMELGDLIATPSKRWNEDLDVAKSVRWNPNQIRVKAINPRMAPTYDIHVDSATNLYLLANGLVTHNSGKSAGGCREVAWLFENSHPFFERPKAWGTGPILILILGKKSEQMETALWAQKIKPLLVGQSHIKEVRSGNALQKVINEENGNTILFQSHNNPQEARKNIQAYTAHYVFLDEMPESHSLVSELVMRITTTDGRMVGAFTPLVHNIKIRKMVDEAEAPVAKRYHFSIYDNPSLADRIEEVIAIIRQNCATEMEFKCRVGGQWMAAGKSVSCYNPDLHKDQLPPSYIPQWRHLAAVDPSASGLTGLTVWAEDPTSGVWWNVKAMYLQGEAASVLVKQVEKEISGYNITHRICDPNPAGFWKEAHHSGIKYRTMGDKKDRKIELIDGTNKALLEGRVRLTQFSEVLEDELVAAAWSESTEDRIINASSYHTFDTMQYAIDSFPKWEPKSNIVLTPEESFKKMAWESKQRERKKQQEVSYRIMGRGVRRAHRARSRFGGAGALGR
jgi:hypothetical protein